LFTQVNADTVGEQLLTQERAAQGKADAKKAKKLAQKQKKRISQPKELLQVFKVAPTSMPASNSCVLLILSKTV